MYDVTPYTCEKSRACGPTSLKMLLDYYGVSVELDQLIEECGVTVAGCSAVDLMRVGRAHGLDMIAFSMTPDELLRQDRPAIVWWKYVHWVVIAGMDDAGQAVICNPSIGRFTIDAGTFGALYSGVSLWNGAPESLPEPGGMTADANQPKGSHFLAGGKIYEATAAILRGAAILPGVNCREITLDEMIGG